MGNQANILRQIKDIQVQADRLIRNNADLTEIEHFSDYSTEIRNCLLKNITDKTILDHIESIPDLKIDEYVESDGGNGILGSIINFFGGAYASEKWKSESSLSIVRDIKAKYASLEFLLRNYFD
ncbi:hypothetical protein GWK08_05090 [Leptobacterium flavescens]|uniref:Uncharacterized protein n=1 Tax=Leptobacterium flavescens TaxID=472055 RepID=A0A6P0UHT3_9FLAO|nr:hypothetical protein [Leptobacterium flavescens]NER12804.1 hypothetical protein [Leptobacterium flavescens]